MKQERWGGEHENTKKKSVRTTKERKATKNSSLKFSLLLKKRNEIKRESAWAFFFFFFLSCSKNFLFPSHFHESLKFFGNYSF